MQAQMIVFDHIAKTVTKVPTGPQGERRLAEIASKATKSAIPTGAKPIFGQ